jgi:DNA-binding transcriptional LysR family regulator
MVFSFKCVDAGYCQNKTLRTQLHEYAYQLCNYEYSNRMPTPLKSAAPNGFDWQLIRSFLAALDAGSLLGAARRLHTSQPTVGRHIEALEAQLGVTLFERTGRGLIASASALQLADSARTMEAASLAIARSVAGAQKRVGGTVRITASQPVASYLLPPLLARMRGVLPDIQVELEASNAVSNLLRREADIALRMVRPDQATLVTKKIGVVPVGAYASRSYLARCGTPRVPTDLLHHAMIGYDKLDDILRGFRAAGSPLTREAFALRSDDLIVHSQAVRAGLGIGFLADYVVRNDADVVRVLPKLALPELPMWLTVHREIRTNSRIRAVFDFLAKNLPETL